METGADKIKHQIKDQVKDGRKLLMKPECGKRRDNFEKF